MSRYEVGDEFKGIEDDYVPFKITRVLKTKKSRYAVEFLYSNGYELTFSEDELTRNYRIVSKLERILSE